MTKQEWIDKDISLFHITQTSNLNSIFSDGLENRNGRGICVVRINDDFITRYICETMLLSMEDDFDFSIIEIKPQDIGLNVEEFLNDSVVEVTNPLHNYINRDKIEILPANVIGKFQVDPMGIPNLMEYEEKIRELFELQQLEN